MICIYEFQYIFSVVSVESVCFMVGQGYGQGIVWVVWEDVNKREVCFQMFRFSRRGE